MQDGGRSRGSQLGRGRWSFRTSSAFLSSGFRRGQCTNLTVCVYNAIGTQLRLDALRLAVAKHIAVCAGRSTLAVESVKVCPGVLMLEIRRVVADSKPPT